MMLISVFFFHILRKHLIFLTTTMKTCCVYWRLSSSLCSLRMKMTALRNNRHRALTLNPDSDPCQLHHFSNKSLILSQCLCSSSLLHRTGFRLQLDELFGHLVSGPLGQDTHHRQARLVGGDARPERTPAHAALAVGDVTQLDHRHADHPVRPAEAVILHRHLQLVAVWGLFTQDATEQERTSKVSN